MRTAAAIGLLFLGPILGGCGTSTGSGSISSPPLADLTQADEDDLVEALFRYQFEHNASASTANGRVESYFLSNQGKDPTPAFLARFAHDPTPVRAGSEFEIGKGVLFEIRELRRVNASTIQAEGGCYGAHLSSSGNTYTLERKQGRWLVTKDQMNWIS